MVIVSPLTGAPWDPLPNGLVLAYKAYKWVVLTTYTNWDNPLSGDEATPNPHESSALKNGPRDPKGPRPQQEAQTCQDGDGQHHLAT